METKLSNQIIKAAGPGHVSHSERSEKIRRWFTEDNSEGGHLWEEDRHVVAWLETQIDPRERSTSQDSIKLIKRDAILSSLKNVSPELMEDIGV